MSSFLQGAQMNNPKSWTRFSRNRVLVSYVLIALLAVMFDLFGDRSFGALMISALPIAVLALCCLLVGPWLTPEKRSKAFKNWLIGAVLVLGVALVFASLGDEQAKTGELIFTYAALVFAFPASLVLPFVMTWIGPLTPNSVWIREVIVLLVCVAAGSAEWWMLNWLREKVGQRKRERSSQA